MLNVLAMDAVRVLLSLSAARSTSKQDDDGNWNLRRFWLLKGNGEGSPTTSQCVRRMSGPANH
jgi:hypothetical protein